MRKGTKTHNEFVNQIQNIQPELEIVGKYVGKRHAKILVKDKYGICNCFATALLKGYKPSISSAVNPTEYFINKAKEIHNDKYDYSLVNYTHSESKIKIICPEHGIFEQTPHTHLKACGCKKCSSNYGWSYNNWKNAGLQSKNFTNYKVYIIKCTGNGETFYKIGKTFTDLKKRFRTKYHLPYDWELIKIYEGEAISMCVLECNLHRLNIENKYLPELNFDGIQECFSQIKYI
jgi:hypothetical protein